MSRFTRSKGLVTSLSIIAFPFWADCWNGTHEGRYFTMKRVSRQTREAPDICSLTERKKVTQERARNGRFTDHVHRLLRVRDVLYKQRSERRGGSY